MLTNVMQPGRRPCWPRSGPQFDGFVLWELSQVQVDPGLQRSNQLTELNGRNIPLVG